MMGIIWHWVGVGWLILTANSQSPGFTLGKPIIPT